MATPLRRMDARSRAEAIVGPNMTPMVDVILVILIFFMATTVIVGEEWFLGAGLSRQAGADAAGGRPVETRVDPFELPPPRFTLRLSAAERGTMVRGLGEAVVVAGPAAMDAWAQAALAGLDASSLVVVIAPAPDVRYEDVVAVHDALVRARIEQIALAPGAGSSRGGGP